MVPYQEQRKATRCVYDTVTDDVEQKYTVVVPYQEQRKATRCVYDTVTDNVEQKYTVVVPYQEERTSSRTVYDTVQDKQTRSVCVDRGQWVCESVPDPANPACLRNVQR